MRLPPSLLPVLALVATGLAGSGCPSSQAAAQPGPAARAKIVDREGRDVGTAEFHAIDGGIQMSMTLTDQEPGEHALHIHEHGDCGGAGFEEAGGHFNPTAKGHGLADEAVDGHHVGDLVNVVVGAKGEATATRIISDATLIVDAPETSKSLLRDGGTSIVLHAKPDDGRTNPAGAAGDRVACGIIVPAPPSP